MTMKHRIAGIGLAVALWATAPGTTAAGVWYVSKAGSDATGDGSTNAPWASITNAVAHSGVGDTIQVAAGVYTQSVTMATTNVTIQGGFNPADWSWDPANQRSAICGNGSSPIILSASATTNALQSLSLYGGTMGGKAPVAAPVQNQGTNMLQMFGGGVGGGQTVGQAEGATGADFFSEYQNTAQKMLMYGGG